MEIKVFQTLFPWWWKHPDSYLRLTDPGVPKTTAGTVPIKMGKSRLSLFYAVENNTGSQWQNYGSFRITKLLFAEKPRKNRKIENLLNFKGQ